MTQYTFTCPIEGCNQVFTAFAQNENEAAPELVEKAKQHLLDVHPDVQKTDEEVDIDIRSHMQQA